ncbi:uncharacterized protein LOC108192651 [Daucus carota subsp. sativus]|uniref:uncharacterized protein LOC108192651 n=1 Tax=Daucus carota subsp. sativus TaxID=79200 RepID=UPI0007EFDD64|nr:PREDICTED: uncharacterized protein LOC108192651 [Daucus carota subsp. sativus]
MNGVRGSGGGRQSIRGAPPQGPNRVKERDEDLLLFKELHKKDRVVSLLQPVSDEFEPTGNYALYRMASAKKGPSLEFLAENEKNDYDWLKTPPATPLFPSLEMEANAPDMVVHRELPIIQTLSRFAGNTEVAKQASSTKSTIARSKSPSPKSKVPFRSTTPNRKQMPNPSAEQKKNSKSAPTFFSQKPSLAVTNTSTEQSDRLDATSTPTNSSRISTLPNQRESHLNFFSSNLSKSIGELNLSKTKPTSRGVSPQVMRSIKTTAQTLGVSDETPPNLKTERSASALRAQADRASSALRGRARRPVSAFRDRPETQNPKQINPVVVETATKTVNRRQSCSPSVTRGRKVVSSSTEENSATTPKGKLQGQVFGSRMVDKFLTARKSSTEEKAGPVLRSRMGDSFSSSKKSSDEEKSNGNGRIYGSINESSGFGRLMAKSSLDVAVKHMQQDKQMAKTRQTSVGRRTIS